jgi:CelD/BcsL family acetyltransferase involved in cellulose biosynthesis
MTKIKVIENTEGFEKLREEWTELLESSEPKGIFLTWEWLFTWWKHLSDGRALSIITVRSGDQLIAVLPLAVRSSRLIRWVPFRALEFVGTGSVGSAYLDLIIRRGKEQEALPVLTDYLKDGNLTLEFTQLKRDSCLAAGLAARLWRHGRGLWTAKTGVCPFIPLSGQSWPSYLAVLGREHRYNFNRKLRKLVKEFDLRFEQVTSEDQRREALHHLITLHTRHWQERDDPGAFHDPDIIEFHREFSQLALDRGWLRLFILWLRGRPAAALYGFQYRRTFYFYQSGFDSRYARQSVGLVALGLSIKNAIEGGADEYDLLHGDEPYKFHWAREVRELGRMELYPRRVRGRLYGRAVRFGRAARRIAKSL